MEQQASNISTARLIKYMATKTNVTAGNIFFFFLPIKSDAIHLMLKQIM